ncbi:MAG: AraC family transcriptional regulator [Pseudomonadales bacterium]|jgi:AraC-like DNA-binding protein
MSFHRSSLATLAQALHTTLNQKGVDADDLFSRCGVDPAKRLDADARYPLYASNKMWRAAIHATKNPSLIYEVVHNIRPAMLHALGHAWIASRTLLEALQRFVRYHQLLSTNVNIKLEQAQGSYQLICEVIDTMDILHSDAVVAFVLEMCRLSYGEELVPLEVHVTIMEPHDATIVNNFFRCSVEYGSSKNVLVFSSTDLSRRLDGANSAVAAAMDEVVIFYLAQLDAGDLVSQVRKFVAQTLIHGEPDKQAIANELNMSPRTLQRRLEEEDTSVKEIVNETRHQLSLSFLDKPHYSIKEVAYALGFSDPSNFARAFRRWTGRTPRQYRTQK